MKIKNLLNLVLFASVGISAQAQTQIFKEDFSAQQTKAETELGWYEFINTQEGDTRTVADGVCKFVNTDAVSCDGQGWQRAIKFRNLKLEEGKVYRLSFECWAESETWGGEGKNNLVRSGLLQGGENCDIAIMTGKKNEGQQYVSWSPVSMEANHKYSTLIYFHSSQNQYDVYNARENKTKDLEDIYFAAINIINPGTYTLDNVVLEEMGTISTVNPVKSAVYGAKVIRMNFLYDTNIADLVKADARGIVELPEGAVTLKVNGAEEEIVAAELHSDGYLYIFRDDDATTSITSMEVSFTNPEEGTICWKNDAEGAIANFTVSPVYDEDFELDEDQYSPWIYTSPVVLSTTPKDGAFALEETISEFTYNFDKAVTSTASYIDGDYQEVAPKAFLKGGGLTEELSIKEGTPEETTSLTYVRTNNTPLSKGQYTVVLKGISSAIGIPADLDAEILFEVGKVKIAQTIYNKVGEMYADKSFANQVPEGWKLVTNNEERNPGETFGSGGRIMDKAWGTGMYFRAEADQEAYVVTAPVDVPAGKVEIRSYIASWKPVSHNATIQVLDNDDNVVAEQTIDTEATNAEGGDANYQFQEVKFRLDVPAATQYKFKAIENTKDGQGLLFRGATVYTYEEIEGDKSDAELIMSETFASCGGNMPAEGTGWIIYENENPLPAGSGRSGTSGILNLGTGGMPAAFFARECGTNNPPKMYITYGEQEGGPQLELSAGRYDITYKSATWNDNGGNSAGTSTTTLQLINAETGDVVLEHTHVNSTDANYMNGAGNNPKVQADKVAIEFNCPGGTYIVKAWGTTNTVWGDFKVEKQGSKAAKYYALMYDAVQAAKEELANADDAKYNGDTKTKLTNEIQEYTDPSAMHTADEFTAAIAKVEETIKAMQTRRSNIDAYPTSLQGILDAVESVNDPSKEKYKNLEQYPTIVECYNNYKDVDYIALSDKDLQAAVDAMGSTGETFKNMVNTCIPNLIIRQITELAKMITDLDSELESNSYVLAVGNAISDDQELAKNLKKTYAAKFYEKCANGNPFEDFDEELEVSSPVEIEVNPMIQNYFFYSSAIKSGDNTYATEKDFPGWDITVNAGGLRATFALTWGEAYATDVKPYENCAVKTGWGSQDYVVEQLIKDLPVAKYTASIQIGEDGGEPHGSYAYVKYGEDENQAAYEGNVDGSAYKRDLVDAGNTKTFTDITPEIANNLASLTLGAHMIIAGGFGNVDNAALTMTGKAEGFDYAAAAKALNEEIALSVEKIKTEAVGEPVSVSYYDLSGKKTVNPRGVTIKVATYANGFTVVTKEVKK